MVKTAVFGALLLCLISPRIASSQTTEEQIEKSFHAGQRDLQGGNFARAVEEFKKVLALDPKLVEADVNLGLAYQSLFEYDLAVRYLSKGLSERPTLLGPAVIIGMDYLKLGSPEKAIPYLQQALKVDPANREATDALASAYLAQENFRSAAEQYNKIASLETDKSEAYYKLGHEYLDLAARLAYRGAHRYRDSAWGHRFLGDLLFQRERWEDALKEYRKALGIEPQQSGLHASLGLTSLHLQNLPEAEKQFRAELQLDSKYEPAWLGLANTQLAANLPKDALDSLQQIFDISPQFLEAQRDFPSVEIKISFSAVEDEAESPAKHFLLARMCAARNESVCADREWKSFQQALPSALEPTGLDSLDLGKLDFKLRRYAAAADSLAQVQGVSKENVEASYWLARTYLALGSEAYARLEESLPNSWRACQLRAEGFSLRGDFDDAVKEFHTALQLRPDEPELHEALAELYLDHHSDDTAAQSELEKALAFDPSSTRALYLLGRLYVADKDNEKALPYLQKAVRLKPDFIEANSVLGTAYVRLGQFAEAIPKLEKAASSDHYGNVHYQLYLAYRKLGRAELAQKELALSEDLRRRYLERDEAIIMGAPQPEVEPR